MGTVHPLGVTPAELSEFFDFLFGDQTGFVYSPTKNPVTDGFEQYFFEWPREKKALIDHVNRYTSTHEVYYGPALFSTRDATKDSFLGTNVVWAEFDGVLPLSLINVPEPSIKIQSSTAGHEHWYWKLEYFVRDQEIVETISQRLTYHLKADLSCWNANRVLRPPGTLHHESAKKTQLKRFDPRTHTLQTFATLPELPIKLLGIGDIHAIPETFPIIAKYRFSEEAIELFRSKAVKKGHRSSALTKLAHFCMEMGMTNAETLSMLYNADERWRKYAGRKDQKERLLGIINYARSLHPVDPVAEAPSSIFRVYSFEEFMATELQVEWVIPELLHKKGLLSLSGPAGIGKSQISLRFAEKIAKGEKFLKWDIPNPLRNIFVSMEMSHEELKYFMEMMAMKENELLKQNMQIMPLGASIRLNNKSAQRELNKVIEKHQPEGIIFDSFGVAVGEDISSDKIIFETLDYIHRTLRLEYGLFVWFIHHPRKEQIGNKKPNKLDDLHGSGYFGRAVSTAISLWQVGKDIEMSCLKLRMAQQWEPFRIQRTPDLDFREIQGGPQKLPQSLMPEESHLDY